MLYQPQSDNWIVCYVLIKANILPFQQLDGWFIKNVI